MSNIPDIVFIVPYRNRPQHKFFFETYLSSILTNTNVKYELYFSHQCDARAFNRGATKNIGFLAVKTKYPNDYKNITFVFNDIDTIPFSNIFNYKTEANKVKHFYGFKYALGGIVALLGADFELINGYPNFWGWGMEDNVLQKRCEQHGLVIDRTQFFPIGSPQILHLFDGISRLINKKDPWRATNDNGIDGLKSIHKLSFTIDNTSLNALDNIHINDSIVDKRFIVNIKTFMTATRFEHDNYYNYDLREPPRKIIHPDRIKTNKLNVTTDDWSNIPFYPTNEKRNEMINEFGEKRANEIIEYSYEHSTDPNTAVKPNEINESNELTKTPVSNNNNILINKQNHDKLIQQYNQLIKHNQQNINKYSPYYANSIGVKPKATASAHIRLGGIYR